ncbi:MAG: T9SS type A sorting domain-containing protein [Ignavibacterium sp.]|nr:T9SS type A sorting domain-containing protein [Ignavibacterium sp.]MDW8374429.1 T9SS type A sorting domain-containing protein [Ignavibacteriales bacterium]
MLQIKNLFLVIILFVSTIYSQWTQVNNGLGSQQIKSLGIVGTNVVAVTANQGIFISSNSGNNWQLHPQNSTLPNFNLNGSLSDVISGGAMIVWGQGFLASLSGSSLIVIPITGIGNNNFSCYTSEEGAGITESKILGTNGGGIYYADNFASTNWTQIPGLNNANARTVTGVYVFDAPNGDEHLIVATRDGAYISPANSLSNLTGFNNGLTGSSRSINNMYGPFLLTKLGIFFLPSDGLSNGWTNMYPTGDFRTAVMDFLGENFYFYGNDVGVRFDGTSFLNENLTGITGGAIVASTIQYLGQTGGYIFVGTENGGVFRKQFVISSVDDESKPTNFILNQNYPNPFNPSTKISWQMPVSGHTTLRVFDVLGNEIATLVDEYREAGNHEVEFNVGQTISLSSGIYFYKIQAGEFVQTKKMTLIK